MRSIHISSIVAFVVLTGCQSGDEIVVAFLKDDFQSGGLVVQTSEADQSDAPLSFFDFEEEDESAEVIIDDPGQGGWARITGEVVSSQTGTQGYLCTEIDGLPNMALDGGIIEAGEELDARWRLEEFSGAECAFMIIWGDGVSPGVAYPTM